MQRRTFIRLAGGGIVAAAGAAGGPAYAQRSAYPAAAVEAWNGPPSHERDPRRIALAYAITAPNPHNLQPWLADLREPQAITVYTDRKRVLPQTDPFGRQILVGHGAFLELLVMALAQQGLRSELTLWPQGELPAALQDWDARPVARLRIVPGAERDPLFAQVLARHTPKVDFDTARPVQQETLAALLASHRDPMVQTGATVDPARLEPLRKLCWDAAQVELLTPATVMESIRLTRVGPQEILRHRDGISINGAMPRVADALGLFDRQNPPAPGSPAYTQMMARFEGHSRTAMGFAWLSTPGNSRSDQIRAGRAYVRLQLQATQLGLGVHPMSQALQEFEAMRPHLERAHRLLLDRAAPAGTSDATVQMLCRLGYTAQPAPATPRRPVSDFISAAAPQG